MRRVDPAGAARLPIFCSSVQVLRKRAADADDAPCQCAIAGIQFDDHGKAQRAGGILQRRQRIDDGVVADAEGFQHTVCFGRGEAGPSRVDQRERAAFRADARSGGSGSGCGGGHFEQPFLVVAVGVEERKCIDRVLWRVEVRDAARLQRRVHVGAVDRAQPRGEYAAFGAHRARRPRPPAPLPSRRIAGRGTCKRDHGIDIRILERERRPPQRGAPPARRRERRSGSRSWRRLPRCPAAARRASRPFQARTRRAEARDPMRRPPPALLDRVRSRRSRAGRPAESVPSDRMRAAANSCVYVCTRTVPARRQRRVEHRIRPKRRDFGSSERPAFSTMTGFVRAAARSAEMNVRASRDLLDIEHDAVGHGIDEQQVEQFAEADVDRPPPSDMTVENPMPSGVAKSSIAVRHRAGLRDRARAVPAAPSARRTSR